MRKEVAKNRAYRLVTAGNIVLVSSSWEDNDNVMTCSWQSPFSHEPQGLLIALAKKHLSSEFIRKSGEFVINIPDFSLIREVMFCGKHSGREVDKFKKANLTREKPKLLKRTVRIKECIGIIECKLREIKDVADHYLFFSEPLYAEAEEKLFDFDKSVWKKESNLIFHLGGTFFSSLGEVKEIK